MLSIRQYYISAAVNVVMYLVAELLCTPHCCAISLCSGAIELKANPTGRMILE